MACKICGRGACAEYMHGAEEQAEWEDIEDMDERALKVEVIDLRREREDLRAELAKYKERDGYVEKLEARLHEARGELAKFKAMVEGAREVRLAERCVDCELCALCKWGDDECPHHKGERVLLVKVKENQDAEE